MRALLPFLFVPLLLASCAEVTHWENPAAPQERWSADLATCRRFAAREAERDYNKQQTLSGKDYLGNENSFDARMAVYQGRKYEQQVLEDCMARKGYKKVKGPAPK